jgi:hypothetical protein
MLLSCLACWAPLDGGEPDAGSLAKLAAFIELQQTFSAGQIVDIMAEARISPPFLQALCCHLLTKVRGGPSARLPPRHCLPRLPPAAPTGCRAAVASPAACCCRAPRRPHQRPSPPAPAQVGADSGLVVRYVQLAAAGSAEGLAALQRRVAALEAQLAPPPPPPAAEGAAAGRAVGGAKRRGGGPLQRLLGSAPLRRLLRPRGLERAASGLLLVTSLLGGQQLGWRLLRTAPLLFLLRRRPGEGAGAAGGRGGRRSAA